MNDGNLIRNEDRTPSERRENARKAGIASGRARREKKMVQEIVSDYLEKKVKSIKSFQEIADMAGITGNQSIKELVTAVCLMNTLKKGGIDDLIKLAELLGEDNAVENLEDISEAEDEIFGNDQED